MQAYSITKLWQAMTPRCARVLMESEEACLQPSSIGDAFALLKLTRGQAFYAGKAVWARLFGEAVVVEIVIYQAALTPFAIESVAYSAHREYRIPVADLPRLSLAQVKPARVIGSLQGSMPSTPAQGLAEKTPTAHLGLGRKNTAQAGILPSL